VSPTAFTGAAIAVGGTATFTDTASPMSIYRAEATTSVGQTSPFSAIYTVP
jgi:hypothetical protein